MSEAPHRTLSGGAETLLITLSSRAMESQRLDALLKDEKAAELFSRTTADEYIRSDFSRVRQIPLSEANKLIIILRTREFDRYVRGFLARSPDAVGSGGMGARHSPLSQWYTFDESEPRLGGLRLLRHIAFIARMVRIVHYRLGEAAE